MKFLKNKKKAGKPNTSVAAKRRGHVLFFYQLPSVLVSVLVVFALAFMARYMVQQATQEQAERSMQSAANLFVAQVAAEVRIRRHLLRLLAGEEALAEALQASNLGQLSHKARLMEGQIPGALQVRLLPKGWNRTDKEGPAPLGYAGIKLLEQALVDGRVPPAEVHQLNSGSPYIALVHPVYHKQEPVGAVLAAFPADLFQELLNSFGELSGSLVLEQRVGPDKRFRLAFSEAFDGEVPAAADAVQVPGTIWQVRRSVRAQAILAMELVEFLALCGLGLLALMLVQHLQSRWLGRHLAEDVDALVAVAKAMLHQSKRPDASFHIAVSDKACQQLIAEPVHESEKVRDVLASKQSAKAAVPAAVPAGEEAASPHDVDVPDNVFRAYDIRGVAGKELTTDFSRLLGQAFGAELAQQRGRKVVIGRDSRHSSPELSRALSEGLASTGAQVIDLGEVPTPLVYFGTHALHADASIVVTASHNPAEYNGFKMMLKGLPVSDETLWSLRDRMVSGTLAMGSGERLSKDVTPSYLARVQDDVHLTQPLKVVVDGGDGIAGPVAVSLFRSLGCEVIPLFCEPDGNFPNRVPDPSQPQNLEALVQKVLDERADLGLAFDGDGDRIALIDNDGRYHWPDKLLMLLASDILVRHPGADVIYDVKCSRHLPSYILSLGGRPQMCRSGHSRMKAKMHETGAELGGEFSGHLFIKDRWYGFDDGLYGAARLLEILAEDVRSVAEVMHDLPSGVATPEYPVPFDDMAQARKVMDLLQAQAQFPGSEVIELDGLRVEYTDGWGLVRQSNTMPALSLRFEADNEAALERIQSIFREQLQRVMPERKLPF